MAVPAPRDSVATYTVTFDATWSATTHPVDFPIGAHFSGLIGATHSDQVAFWEPGTFASPGIQAMAELGSKSPLSDEIAAAITAGTAQFLLSGPDLRPSPGQASLEFQIEDSHPLVTLVSMIAPSPDWFVGVRDLSLQQDGNWIDSMSVVLRGWDAGTDAGTTYAAANAPASPHLPIQLLLGPLFESSPGVITPMGSFTFVRKD